MLDVGYPFNANRLTLLFELPPPSQVATGLFPWAHLSSPVQIIFAVAVSKERPPLPASLAPPLRALVAACWADAPRDRPSFLDVAAELDSMLRALGLGLPP